jgi:hypothetical protein
MKTWFGNKILLAVIIVVLALATSHQVAGQTTMGILPVNVSTVGSSVISVRQWQSVAFQLHDYLVVQLAGTGTVSKLSREHILLLLKEVPATDPENLDAEAYVIISKKEKLQYLLKCSVVSVKVNGKNVISQMEFVIVDGNTGKMFWEDTVEINRMISTTEISEQVLLNEVFKPSVNEISKEIIKLNY